MHIERAAVGSEKHLDAMQLRERVLRVPLGLAGLSADELLAEPNAVHLVCCEGERVIGTLILVEERPGVLRMRQVAVLSERRGRGVGRLLVQSAEQHCLTHGIDTLVAHARANVVPFYEALGYRVVGEPFIEVTIEHRLVEKVLTNAGERLS